MAKIDEVINMVGIVTKSNVTIAVVGAAATGITWADWATQNKDLIAVSVGIATITGIFINMFWRMWRDHLAHKEVIRHNLALENQPKTKPKNKA